MTGYWGDPEVVDHPAWTCPANGAAHSPLWVCCPCDHHQRGCCWHCPENEPELHAGHECVRRPLVSTRPEARRDRDALRREVAEVHGKGWDKDDRYEALFELVDQIPHLLDEIDALVGRS